MGWLSLIPVVPREKRPAIAGWQRFNRRPPTEEEIETWASAMPSAGIGLVYGPDKVIALDQDFKDWRTASAVADIVDSTLGNSPLVRIGRPPKRLTLYKSASGLIAPGKAFGGFEVYAASGQTVLYGLHPDTGRPYVWPEESPFTLSPNDLPVATQAQLHELIAALSPFRINRTAYPDQRDAEHNPDALAAEANNTAVRACLTSDRSQGIPAALLPVLRASSDPVSAAARALAQAPEGARHYTAVGAIVALMELGFSNNVIRNALGPIYLGHTLAPRRPQAGKTFDNALRWARARIGPDADAISASTGDVMQRIAAAWDARWRPA